MLQQIRNGPFPMPVVLPSFCNYCFSSACQRRGTFQVSSSLIIGLLQGITRPNPNNSKLSWWLPPPGHYNKTTWFALWGIHNPFFFLILLKRVWHHFCCMHIESLQLMKDVLRLSWRTCCWTWTFGGECGCQRLDVKELLVMVLLWMLTSCLGSLKDEEDRARPRL